MTVSRRTRRTWLITTSIAGVLIVALGAVLLVGRGGAPSPDTAAPGTTTPATPGTAAPGTTAPTPGETMTVTVFFHRGAADDPQRVVPVGRTVPRSAAVATAALGQLLAGPTDAEREAGYVSQFGPATAGSLISVRVANGVARADFREFSTSIPNASSSFGSAALLAELDATLKQFPTVTSTVYSFEGDVRAFYEWLQLAPPVGVDGDTAVAVGTARRFLGHVVGMHRPAGGEFRSTGADAGEVVFWARSPHGTPLREIATVVPVRRDGGGWSATGSTTSTILVDTPAAGHEVTSPVLLRGRSVAFEGTVSVRVLAERAGGATEIGRGFVTGGGDALGPFSGQVDIQPPDAAAGWVVFFEESAADGSVLRATTVPVLFASAAEQPAIHQISWEPELPLEDGWLRLPDGPGRVTFTVEASSADRVELFLTPTGTGTAPLARSLGTGTRTDAGFVIAWSYPDEPQFGHLSFVATGPGGRSEDQPFNLSHD